HTGDRRAAPFWRWAAHPRSRSGSSTCSNRVGCCCPAPAWTRRCRRASGRSRWLACSSSRTTYCPSRSPASSCSAASSARWSWPSARSDRVMVPITYYIALSAILFSIGIVGVLVRRNAIVIFLCIELMLNAANLAFVAFAQQLGVAGQIFVFFVMAVAAAEAAVGLAIILAVSRHRQTVDLQDINLLKG